MAVLGGGGLFLMSEVPLYHESHPTVKVVGGSSYPRQFENQNARLRLSSLIGAYRAFDSNVTSG